MLPFECEDLTLAPKKKASIYLIALLTFLGSLDLFRPTTVRSSSSLSDISDGSIDFSPLGKLEFSLSTKSIWYLSSRVVAEARISLTASSEERENRNNPDETTSYHYLESSLRNWVGKKLKIFR